MSALTFDLLLRQAVPPATEFQTRTEGPAFLNVARNLYGFELIDYLVLNIPVRVWKRQHFRHCRHATNAISQCMTHTPAATAAQEALSAAALHANEGLSLAAWRGLDASADGHDGLVFGLRSLHGELAVAAVSWRSNDLDVEGKRLTAMRDLRVLMNYFHSHVLRINGVDSSNEILMSARELDCLSWTAAGKTAWEASIILGISERTVRFHLNVAREKLNCATTTQAVAKAISQQLIQLSA